MATYNTSANVILNINGRQAQRMLSTLERDAKRLEAQIAKAAAAGNKASMQKFQRELNQTKKMMDQLKNSSSNVDNVLRRLDKASPKELKSTLKSLQQQLNGIERGSAAWNSHIAKIKAVKSEIQKMNAQMAAQKSLWSRMNSWLNSCQTAILGYGAAITGLVMAGRKAVNAFAEMEEQLANTKKYTGLTDEDVRKLNDAFKGLDTRTPREKLNELAQEAGRLGKNTIEDVKGYVEAADIINVALVDLGDGATQTIAKLTNIFGVEELLGTKDAMLAVGSTVNVLSQNCTASKPYLVEFAQRMAGIGSQAGLTIPEILAFGAVLDSNGQKVEMSATAIQKVIMNLANKNQEFAKRLGLDANLLNETLKHSARDGLLMFLEALRQMGQDVGFENATMTLAPAFKDMGLDAARVSAVLSTLAMHLDEVKWQMGEAETAFREASSATKEYEIFNNTAQSEIDKAKKRVTELAIELGQKLFPVMKHIYTSSGVFLRVLNQFVSFIIKYKSEIAIIAGALAAYNAVMLIHNVRTAAAAKAIAVMNGAMRVFGNILKATKILFVPLINTVEFFTNGLKVNYDMQKRWRDAMTAMNLSNWVGMITTAVAALWLFTKKIRDAKKEAEEAAKKAKAEREEWLRSISDIETASAEHAANELTRLKLLYTEATNEALAKDKRRQAAEKLLKLYPAYFKNMTAEAIMLGQAKTQYNELADSIIAVARARAAASKIEENEGLLLEAEAALEKAKKDKKNWEGTRDKRKGAYDKAKSDFYEKSGIDENYEYDTKYIDQAFYENRTEGILLKRAEDKVTFYSNKINEQQKRIDDLKKANKSLVDKYGKDIVELNDFNFDLSGLGDLTPIIETPSTEKSSSSTPTVKSEDKFKAEKDWREREEALNRIAYAIGEKNYVDYTKRMIEIESEFYKKQLEHTDLSQNERLSIQAQYYEATKKSYDENLKFLAEDLQAIYDEKVALAKQSYIDGKFSFETYNEAIERAEMDHLKKMVDLYEEGSKERLKAEKDLQDKLFENQQKKQKQLEELESKYAEMKKDYFGDNPQEAQAKYDADLALLDVVYQRELQAAADNAEEKLRIDEAYEKAKLELKKKYGLIAEEESKNIIQKSIDDSVEWLKDDGGKALTGTMDALVNGMSSIFSQLSSVIQAELEMQTAAIEKRYDAEIDRAEGNSYKIKKLEKQKEEEIAKLKNEANRKLFAMQVIQAVAQTAQNAISAYGSAAAIPMVGYILAPIAAAMAVAAGAIQIAAIKKQQQASEAQGYMSGGFTGEGRIDEVAGVVHKGEWVASQKLTKNPQTRPLLEALDYAQKNNTIGSIRMADVSRTISAPMVLAAQASNSPVIIEQESPKVIVNQDPELVNSLVRLNKRLDDPFVTINTVSGDHGIQKAQNDYDKLMRNKSPKKYK